MLRIENWSAVLASWLVILANLQAGSAEAELPANYRKVQAHANEDRSFVQALELNATPLTTHTPADSIVEGRTSVVLQNVRGDEGSADNPQVAARRMGDEAKSLKTSRSTIRRRENPAESDQSDYLNLKKTRSKEIGGLKASSTGDVTPFKEDPTPSRKQKTKEWSGLVNSKSLRGEDTRVIPDSSPPTLVIPDSIFSRTSRDPIEQSPVQENHLLNPASKTPPKSPDRKAHDSFTLKTEQLQAHSETRTDDNVPERITTSQTFGTIRQREEYQGAQANFDGDIPQNATQVWNNRRFFDGGADKPTETSKVTGQSATIVAERRETPIDRESDTQKLTGQRADSPQSHSRTENRGSTDDPVLLETGPISESPIDNNMTKLPNPRTTAFSTKSKYSPEELASTVNRDGEREMFTTSRHEDKSSDDSIKKEGRAFGKHAERGTEEPTRFSSRSHWNEEGDALVVPRDTTVAIEFQSARSPVHLNTPANALVKKNRASARGSRADHVAKGKSRLPHRESANARFRVDKRRGFSKQTLGANTSEGKDPAEKAEDILHPGGGELAFPGEAATTPGDIHRNAGQTDVTIGRRAVKIENILASGTASTTGQDDDPPARDPPLKRGRQRKQLLDMLGHNIASSGSSRSQRALETNFNAGRTSNVHDAAGIPPAELRAASAPRAGVLPPNTDRIASKQDHPVSKAPEKDELNGNEDTVTVEATSHSHRASAQLDYSPSSQAKADAFQTGLNSENKAIPVNDNHTQAIVETPHESHSTPEDLGKQSRSSIMRERNASDASREMTARLTEAKAASNMEREEDQPSIAARNVEVPYTNSAGGHLGDRRDQWIARNSNIAPLALLNFTLPAATREESATDKPTNEEPSSSPSPICGEREGERECGNEDDKQDVEDSSARGQVAVTESSTEEGELAGQTTSENEAGKSDKSVANETTGKLIDFKRTKERGSNETTDSGSYPESDDRVNQTEVKEANGQGATAESNAQDSSNGIPSVAVALPERHSRDDRLWHASRTESLAYTKSGSGSTLPQEADTERQQLDRASSDPPPREEYDPPGAAVTPTKIDSPPQTSSPSTAGIPTSSDPSIPLRTDKPVARGIGMEILAAASTNWSESYTYTVSDVESTTLRETLATSGETLEKKDNETSEKVIGMSTEDWLNIEKETTKSGNSSLELLDQWPVKHSAVVEGDLVLGGLMMVHEREDTITCGPVMPQGGVQALEAMLYTLDKVKKLNIVPNVTIGAHILDDCDKDTYGLEMAVDFIKDSISNIDGAEYHCNKTTVRKVISGVVGAASSVTSIQVANLLRLFRIPQVSFFSTSPELSNKQRFEYFTRTIPSDHYQVKAMVDIIIQLGWSYVSIIYEESNYGIKAFEELEELLGKNNICIAIKEKLVKDSGVAEETAYDNIVLKLLTKPRAKGCIIFGSDQEVAGVMRAVRRCNATGAFSWIGSDGWSARDLVSNGNEPEVEGTLSVQPQANPVQGFEEYFLNLTVENNRRNPWFVEFWEDHFQCRYPNSAPTPYNKEYTKECTTKERLTKQDTAFEDQLQFVSDAVMAFAYALRDMHNNLCHGKPGLCEAMKPTKGTELLKYLRTVNFTGLSGDEFNFDKNGDGPARYNIIHFKQTDDGKYKWIRVGKYLSGVLNLNMSEIQFKRGHHEPPESVCSLPCEVGQAKKYVEGEKCCWHCFNCTQYQIRHPKDETQCIPCRQGTVPDETHSSCRDIPEEFLRPESGWAIGAMSFSATGMLITFFVCGVFLRYNDTPVVRASGRELSYILLSGILLCYLVTFALVLRPTDIVCGIQRFAAGFCFTVVYAALLTKTNRISRIFNASKHSAKRPSLISPRSQLIICAGMVFVQILINGVWMVIDPARAMHHYPTREDNLLVCNSYIDASYMIAFAYPIMLIVVCTVYAVLTRKIPEAFNESKHIGFTMYTTCVIWLAFVPLYFGTGNNVALRITSMSVTISLSASVTIVCLFSPKLYIILIRPERNVRQSMMPFRCGTTKSSAGTTNASSMIAPVTLTAATCDQNKAVKKHITTTIDCSTQSEYYELEVKDQKNGKPPPAVMSRSTQTASVDKETIGTATANKETKENTAASKKVNNNNARIGNGPVAQSDVSL